MPFLLQKFSANVFLSGVTETAPFPEFSLKGLLNGSFQETANTYYSENLPGRGLMIKVRNQVIFSLFSKSPNSNIIVGKEDVLFEREYVLKYEKYYPPVTREFTEDLCTKLASIQERLESRGKELYIFITPTKARYYEEYVPDIYVYSNRFPDEPGNYEQFTETLKQYDLHVYDSVPYINQLAETADYPFFHRTGTHWSQVLSAKGGRQMRSIFMMPSHDLTGAEKRRVLIPEGRKQYGLCISYIYFCFFAVNFNLLWGSGVY